MLEVNIRKRGSFVVMALTGEVDCAEESRCAQALEKVPAEPGSKLIIDLSGVTFMDSTGIKLLLLADRRARLKGLRRPVVRGASVRVMRVLDTAGVTAMLNIEPDGSSRDPRPSPASAEHPSIWGRRMATP